MRNVQTELSIDETAERLGISPGALRKRITRGSFDCQVIRRGRSLFVQFEDRCVASKGAEEDKLQLEEVAGPIHSRDDSVVSEDVAGDSAEASSTTLIQSVDTSSVAVGMAMQTAITQAVREALSPVLGELAQAREGNMELLKELRDVRQALDEVIVCQRKWAEARDEQPLSPWWQLWKRKRAL